MTVEFIYLEPADFPRMGNDQEYLVIPTAQPVGTPNNPQTSLLASKEGSGEGGDSTAPTVTLVSPLSGLLQKVGEVVLRVTDASGLRRAAVWHTARGNKTEVVWDGFAFRSGYTGSKLDITNGFELTVQRVGGFFPPLIFEVLAIDTSGNEASA